MSRAHAGRAGVRRSAGSAPYARRGRGRGGSEDEDSEWLHSDASSDHAAASHSRVPLGLGGAHDRQRAGWVREGARGAEAVQPDGVEALDVAEQLQAALRLRDRRIAEVRCGAACRVVLGS